MRLVRWLLLRVLPDSAEGHSILGDFLEEHARRPPGIRRAGWTVGVAADVASHYLPSRIVRSVSALARDGRYALRLAGRHARVFAMAGAGLALAIGFTTAAFTVASATSIKQAISRDPSLVRIWRLHSNGASLLWPRAEALQLRDVTGMSIALIATAQAKVVWSGSESLASVGFVSSDYFLVTQGKASLGRMIAASDERPSGVLPVVLDRTYWRRQLGGDRTIIGRPLTFGGTAAFVVGVADRDFTDPAGRNTVMWTPMWAVSRIAPKPSKGDEPRFFPFLRLPEGITLEHLNATLAQAATRISTIETPRLTIAEAAFVTPDEARVATLKTIAGLAAILIVVLILAYTNAAILLLALAASRRHEIAVRLSCGATRTRIAVQLMAEAALLSAIAGAAGLVIAHWLSPVMAVVMGRAAVDLDPARRVYMFGAAAVIGAALVIAAATKHVVLGRRLTSLRTDSRDATGTDPALRRVRTLCVAAQAAASVVLVVLGALQLRALVMISNQDPGFDVEHVITLAAPWPTTQEMQARMDQFWTEALERVRSLPGTQAAARGSDLPFTQKHGDPLGPRTEIVGADYFETLGVSVRQGRTFTSAEAAAKAHVAVINESLAKRFWFDEDPIGSNLRVVSESLADFQIIGVVADTTNDVLNAARTPIAYVPGTSPRGGLAVRSSDPIATAANLVGATQDLLPGVPLTVTRVGEKYARDFDEPRRFAMLAATAALFGLVLSMAGLIGVTTYAIRTRMREIGVRKALGAQGRDVVLTLAKDALRPVAFGLPIGVCASLLSGRLVAHELYGISDRDPAALTLAIAVMTAATLTAVVVPALRATRIDPAQALRDL